MRQVYHLTILTAVLLLPSVTFATGNNITRADFVVNMMASKGLYGNDTHCFKDVTNQAFAPAVCEAKARGYVRGYGDGKFHPFQNVTLVDAAVFAMRAEGVSLPNDTMWYRPAIEKLADWDAIPKSLNSIAMPLSVSQANDVLISVRNRGDDDDDDNDDDDDEENVEHDDDNDDFTVTIDESNDPIRSGATVTYRIRIKNNGNSDETIDVEATLDDDMMFVSASEDGDEDDDVVAWDDIRVDEDDTETLLLTVRLDNSLDDGDTVTLRVRADGNTETESTRIDDDNDDNNDDDDHDLDISITETADPVEEGEVITYRITVTNNENSRISTDIRAFLDDETSFTFASLNGQLRGDDEVEWDNVGIDRDRSVTLLLSVRPRSSVNDGDEVELRVEAEGEEDSETTRIEDE